MSKRVYCDGPLAKATLKAELDAGFVLTDFVRNGYSGGDVAYFRRGTDAEIADCRSRSAWAGGWTPTYKWSCRECDERMTAVRIEENDTIEYVCDNPRCSRRGIHCAASSPSGTTPDETPNGV